MDADFGTRKLAREVFVARSIRSKILNYKPVLVVGSIHPSV
jgi:hypothetical protein